jgi:hypothetical protein
MMSDQKPLRIAATLLTMGAGHRVLGALAMVAVLWLAVWWALH